MKALGRIERARRAWALFELAIDVVDFATKGRVAHDINEQLRKKQPASVKAVSREIQGS